MPQLPKPHRPYWHKPKPEHSRSWVNPWYNTRRWQVMSRQVRYLDYPKCTAPKLCVSCPNLCTTADHIINVSSGKDDKEKESLMWDINNIQPMCDTCHARKSQSEGIRH